MNNILTRTAWLVLLSLCCTLASAQYKKPLKHRYVFEVAHNSGYLLSAPKAVKEEYMHGYQLGIGRQFEGQDYPYDSYISGILTYQDYSHPVVKDEYAHLMNTRGLGRYLSLGVSIRHHYWQNKWYSISGVVENGYGYQFAPHATQDARLTQSGYFQIYFNAGFHFTYTINKHHDISMGPQFTHVSNAGTYLPNNGLNSLTWSARYHYYMGDKEEKVVNHSLRRANRLSNQFFYFDARVGAGVNARNKSSNPDVIRNSIHASINSSVALMYRLNVRHGLGLGADYFYNPTGAIDGRQNYLGAAIKHESFYNHLGVHVNLGFYTNESHFVSSKSHRRTRFYEQIGMRWFFKTGNQTTPYLGYLVKGNGGFYAENIEMHLGFLFAVKKRP